MHLPVLQSGERGDGRTTPDSGVDVRALQAALTRAVAGDVRFDSASLALYSTDASNYRQTPIGVVAPRTVEDVVAAVAVCRAYGVPVTSRGAGTGLAGGACNVAVILDCSRHLNRIIEIDPQRRLARVQPGVILDDLRAAAAEHGLTFGPDPSTHAYCTLGGMIGNNACGVHSITAGRTSDCVEALEVLTYDGVRLRVGRTDDQQLQRLLAAGGRVAEIFAGLKRIADEHGQRIRSRFPRIPRRVSGYNLDDLLPEKGLHVARALVGTEGTCVVVLEATLNLTPSPRAHALLVLGYKDVYEAGDHVTQVLAYQPVGLEGMDEKLIAYVRRKYAHPQGAASLPEGGGWLLAEFAGDTPEQANARARRCMEGLVDRPDAPHMMLYDDPQDAKRIWKARESGLAATTYVPGMADTWPGWEDAAVAPADLGRYLRDFRALLDRFGYRCALYGHFGDGCVHCRIDFDLASQAGIDHYRAFLDEASDLVARYKGSFTAEHGDGQARAIFLPKLFGPELIEAHRQFKRLWDPQGKMNPGKVVDPDPPESNLRLGAGYPPWEPDTHYHWPNDDGRFSKALLRCVGVGQCRRTNDAFMCPSFLATHEEQHTTRGRARMLFEMTRGETITDGWKSKAVHDSLDLCLGCKGCKSECPVGVDMAAYKEEFLSHYYERRIRPRSHYAMGLIGVWAKLAGRVPRLVNFAATAPLLGRVVKSLAGVSPMRTLPAFAAEPFTRVCRGRNRTEAGSGQATVVLYPDAYYDHFHPDVLHDALEVLERLGYAVLTPGHDPSAIRPLLHYGMLARARRVLGREVRRLLALAGEHAMVVMLEPSEVSVFRDDLHHLFPTWPQAAELGERVLTFSEFLDQMGVALPHIEGEALLHTHCHHKAVLGRDSARRVLERMGLRVNEPEPGCCGMAGSFGYEAEHYALSMTIGGRNLFPAIRATDERTVLTAEGFSCLHQMHEGGGRQPMHMAQLVAAVMRDGTLPQTRATPAPTPNIQA